MVNVDACPFFGFLRSDLLPWGYGNRCFLVALPPDSKDTKLGSSDQEASPLAGKNTGVVLVPCLHMEVHPYSYYRWCGYFWGSWVSVRVLKITSGLVSQKLTAYLSFFFNLFKLNELWPYYQKHVNQIILNCTSL